MTIQIIERVLRDNKFTLVRHKRHRVYRRNDGATWTVPSTPSDHRGLENNYANLLNFIERGRATGSFGDRVVTDRERTVADRMLKPVKAQESRQVKERTLGTDIEKWTRMRNVPLPLPPPPPRPVEETLDVYQVGSQLRRWMTKGMNRWVENAETKLPAFLEEIRQALIDNPDRLRQVLLTPGMEVDWQNPEEVQRMADLYIESFEPIVLARIETARKIAPVIVEMFVRAGQRYFRERDQQCWDDVVNRVDHKLAWLRGVGFPIAEDFGNEIASIFRDWIDSMFEEDQNEKEKVA
jgi:hypothetical protein